MIGKDIAANFAGRTWAMLMGVAFVPVYLDFLGIEAYGLIGFYATMQGVLIIADFGLSWTITRELARARAQAPDRIPDMVRTLEVVYWLIALTAGAAVVLLGGFLSDRWIRSQDLTPEEVKRAVQLIGVVLAVQMPSLFYQGGLNGLDRQPTANLILAWTATLRWAGAAVVLWLWSPTIQAFFAWQVLVACIATTVTAATVWRLAGRPASARFDRALLRDVWRFTFAVTASAIAGVLAMQVDKLVLSKLITLEQFGYYSLAVLVASILQAIVTPINTALYPRLSELHGRSEIAAMSRLYHGATQLLAVLMIPAAIVLVFFSHEVLHLWTGNATTAQNASMLLSLLVIGNLLYGFAGIANLVLIAAGWPIVSALALACVAAVVLPSLILFVPQHGPTAAALIWVLASAGYLAAIAPITHWRLLSGELGRWLAWSVVIPLALVSALVAGARWWMPSEWSSLTRLAFAALSWAFATSCIALALPETRRKLVALFVLPRIATPS